MTSDSTLAASRPEAADEGTHEPDADILWSESHYLDTVAPGAETGVYVRLGRLANQGRSHVMLAVVRPGRGPVILADPGAPSPTIDGTDLRVTAAGYRLELVWDEPLRRLRVTASGTATGYAGAADVLWQAPGDQEAADRPGPEAGHPVAVEADLTWHTDGTPFRWRNQTRYEIPCRVSGHVTIDGERIDVDWVGQRDHSWGARDWWTIEWTWMAVHLDDGSRWHSSYVPVYPTAGEGYFQLDGAVTETASAETTASFSPEGLFGTTIVRIEPGGHTLYLSPVAFAPVAMVAEDGRVSFFPRATCRVTTADGRTGVGWVEWNLLTVNDDIPRTEEPCASQNLAPRGWQRPSRSILRGSPTSNRVRSAPGRWQRPIG